MISAFRPQFINLDIRDTFGKQGTAVKLHILRGMTDLVAGKRKL